MKTTLDKFDELSRVIRSSHPYEVPEIVAVPIVAGSPDYLAWISEETRGIGESA
jgi:periplasmic divalent cation tolerance protein